MDRWAVHIKTTDRVFHWKTKHLSNSRRRTTDVFRPTVIRTTDDLLVSSDCPTRCHPMGLTHYIAETYQQENYMKAYEIMNLKDQVADLDYIISILTCEGEWELADDLVKISKSFEEVVEKLRSVTANDNYNI